MEISITIVCCIGILSVRCLQQFVYLHEMPMILLACRIVVVVVCTRLNRDWNSIPVCSILELTATSLIGAFDQHLSLLSRHN